VQLITNPALNPDEDVIVVFGLRARVSFYVTFYNGRTF
jgi:hypothetical protein